MKKGLWQKGTGPEERDTISDALFDYIIICLKTVRQLVQFTLNIE